MKNDPHGDYIESRIEALSKMSEPTADIKLTYGELDYILCGLEEIRYDYRFEAQMLKGWSDDRSVRAMDHAKAITQVMAKLRRKEKAMRDAQTRTHRR